MGSRPESSTRVYITHSLVSSSQLDVQLLERKDHLSRSHRLTGAMHISPQESIPRLDGKKRFYVKKTTSTTETTFLF